MKRGFTLIELLVYIGIFTVAMIAFTTILVTVTQVQSRQTSQNEVTSQSQFLLQQMQYYIAQASLIDMSPDTPTTTLTLRMAATSADPTIITFASGTVYLAQGSNAPVPLTSPRVTISGLTFTKRSNPPAPDSVSINFTMAFTTNNLTQMFSQLFETSVSDAYAASFSSNVVPSSTNTYSLGTSGAVWTSVNGVIDFSGSNVGINQTSPQAALDVNGGMRLDPQASGQPTCSATIDGTFWIVAGTPDHLYVCAKGASTYAWTTIY